MSVMVLTETIPHKIGCQAKIANRTEIFSDKQTVIVKSEDVEKAFNQIG